MSEKIKSFKDLEIWKKGMEISKGIYKLTRQLPKEEQYGLVTQMRRSAVSLPANIAEGFRRRHNREYRQFLHIALGSSGELETYLELCKELYHLDGPSLVDLCRTLESFQRMTNSLVGKLRYE